MSVPITSVKVWINAFIPRDIPGYTRRVPGHGGDTMIPGPDVPIVGTTVRIPPGRGFRPGLPPVTLSPLAYRTDQRSFSNFIHASSRMHSEVRLDLRAVPPTLYQWHHCDETIEYDALNGDVVGRGTGSTSRMQFRMRPVDRSGWFVIDFECAGHNPCVASSALFGDIDYRGALRFNPLVRAVELDVRIDDFPAFEGYATLNDGAGVKLFTANPPPGNTVMKLPGLPKRRLRCCLEDRDGDAILETIRTL